MSTVSQRNFAAGEIAPAIYPKVDQVKYQTGVKTARNCYVMRFGGLTSRPGTKFVCEVKDSSAAVRLIPHFYNALTTFFFEFGNQYIRRIKNGAPLLRTDSYVATITNITTASEAVVTSAAHGYSNNKESYFSGVVGMTELNGRYFTVSDVTANTFKLKYKDGTYVNSTSFAAYISGGRSLLVDEVTSSYLTADLLDIRYASAGNYTLLAHPSYQQSVVALYSGTATHPGLMTSPITFSPASSTNSPTGLASPQAYVSTRTITWYLTAINDETGEESAANTLTKATAGIPSNTNIYSFNATGVSGCSYYRFYRKIVGVDGAFGYLTTVTLSELTDGFWDNGQFTPNPSIRPSSQITISATANNYATCIGASQQRVLFGGSINNPNRVYLSALGAPMIVTFLFGSVPMQRSFPLVSSDAFLIDIVNRNFGSVKHIVDLDRPILFTDNGEFILSGDQSGSIIPTSPNPQMISENGASSVTPVIVNGSVVYVQARGQIVRDLSVQFETDGYNGNDLSTFSAHLVENLTIVDMAYQKTPHSVLWLVRSDGALLSLTYVKEQKILGWARHDFEGGTVERVVCQQEGIEDAVYVVVKRTINGRTTRYIEQMKTRIVDDVTDYVGMDSSITQDGTNTTATTMTISGGTSWTYDEHLTVTASSIVGVNLGLDAGKLAASTGLGFSAADVGNAIDFYDSNGVFVVRILIDEYTSTTVVKGRASETVPVAYRSTAIATWGHAKTIVRGIFHLVGEAVSVFADGSVIASPNNDAYSIITVSAVGTVTLPAPAVKVHVGLPFTVDIETLDVDSDRSETLADKKSNPSAITMHLEKTRGVFVGAQAPSDDDVDPLEKLTELKIRNLEGYNDVSRLFTGTNTENIQSNWNTKGRVFIRQVDPLPMTVNSIMPAGLFPFKNKAGG